ncbi:hypothetical protein CVIRNUC_010467 [Coccomyxa viridis]|uniref:Uncharacterized protein n=1 Tax=Coccomyxa viridis TaxID=1274662 RepID=A0AAV1IME0_9CHLO|nr:hypothetical protein CVIRNUC_010467 [Coccomyxa viridis]
MSHVYGPDGRVRRPVKRMYPIEKENKERVSRKGSVNSAVSHFTSLDIGCQHETAQQPVKRGQEARIKETLHSSLRFDSNDGAYVGLTAAQGADRAVFSSRPLCGAKAALYASSISLREDAGAAAGLAAEPRHVSELKRLEVSGSAGSIIAPAPEACESRISRRASLSTSARQHASSIVMAGDSPCAQGSAAQELPGPVPAPEPTPAPVLMPRRRLRARAATPPSVRRQNRDRSPNVRPPPGGASSVTLG